MLKKSIYTLVFVISFYSVDLLGQPSIQWSRMYILENTDDAAYSICNSGDGHFYVAGSRGLVLKINNYGDTLWKADLTRNIFATIATPDFGCIVIETGIGTRATKFSSNGSIIWIKELTPVVTLGIYYIDKTIDNKVIMCGSQLSGNDGVLIKIDFDGNVDWIKYFTGSKFSSLDLMPDGGYVLTGENRTSPNDTSKAAIVRVDALGNTLWQNHQRVFNRPTAGGYIKRINGGFFMTGGALDTTNSFENNRLYIFRTDTSGNLLMTKLFPNDRWEYFSAAKQVSNNRLIIATDIYSDVIPNDTAFAKTYIVDTLGNVIYTRNIYSQYFLNTFFDITIADNKDILLAGFVYATVTNDNFLVCRVDSTLAGTIKGISNYQNLIPQNFKLYPNYPNPFNPVTKFKLDIPNDGTLTIKIYDILGKQVATLADKELNSGSYEFEWNAEGFSSGIYFTSVIFGNLALSQKVILIK